MSVFEERPSNLTSFNNQRREPFYYFIHKSSFYFVGQPIKKSKSKKAKRLDPLRGKSSKHRDFNQHPGISIVAEILVVELFLKFIRPIGGKFNKVDTETVTG